jgi:hypothetical protein
MLLNKSYDYMRNLSLIAGTFFIVGICFAQGNKIQGTLEPLIKGGTTVVPGLIRVVTPKPNQTTAPIGGIKLLEPLTSSSPVASSIEKTAVANQQLEPLTGTFAKGNYEPKKTTTSISPQKDIKNVAIVAPGKPIAKKVETIAKAQPINEIASLPSLLDGAMPTTVVKPIKSNNVVSASVLEAIRNASVTATIPTNDYALPPLVSKVIANEIKNQPTKTINAVVATAKPIANTNNNLAQANIKNTIQKIQPKMPDLAPLEVLANKEKLSLMPDLAPIEGLAAKVAYTGTPDLAPIDNTPIVNNTPPAMPELAVIEGKDANAKKEEAMPDLAPIEEINNNSNNQSTINNDAVVYNTPKVATNLKSLTIPKGTSLTAQDRVSYIFKPAQVQNIEPFLPTQNNQPNIQVSNQAPIIQNYLQPAKTVTYCKPRAGGAMEISYFDEDEDGATQYQYQGQQQQPVAQQQAKPHTATCPCCHQKKKVWYKKPFYKAPVYKAPPQIVYVERQAAPTVVYQQAPAPKPSQTIVYVPVQQYQEPAKQQAQPVQQQDRVVYTNYTKAYIDAQPAQNNCNCPSTTTNSNNYTNNKANSKPAAGQKQYIERFLYNQNGYAGVAPGPTGGFDPIYGPTSDAPMKYSFYLTPRGKYSVGIYNDAATVYLTQDGKVLDYKYSAPADADPKKYRPKLNSFGKPENVGGVPIEYNYNRSVHKIGNIELKYDFEGFLEHVNGSNVQYNSRSSILQVDNVKVRYDSNGNIESVDDNDGLIIYNPSTQQSN